MDTTSTTQTSFPANLPMALQVRLYQNGMTTVVIDKDFPTPKPKGAVQDEFFSMGAFFQDPKLVAIIARHIAYWDRPRQCENMPNEDRYREECYMRMRDRERFDLDRAVEGALMDFYEHLARRHPNLKTKPNWRGPMQWQPSQNIDWIV